jgi:hypothetical protein
MGSETVIKSQKFSQTKYGIKLVFDFLHLTFVSFNYELCAMQTYHTYAARVFVFELCLQKLKNSRKFCQKTEKTYRRVAEIFANLKVFYI